MPAEDRGKEDTVAVQSGGPGVLPLEEITITVIYDNRVYRDGFEPAWGFSCLITGTEKTILFDTGGDGAILMRNMERAGVDPASIDLVFLSHEHWDHTGGLGHFFEKNKNVSVYCLKAFPEPFKEVVQDAGAGLIEADKPGDLCPAVHSTGEMGRRIKEHALVLDTDHGLIVITGCAHPGIVKIVERAKEKWGRDILFVMGGFHLMEHTRKQLDGIIADFTKLGVQYAAPCHCTGDGAIEAFEADYGDRFIRIGAGRIIAAADFN
jgi:7,8-dihydropterin-6-yl-methyl-4-(beta-D-ribofuranosyl)aminobenzene 5'-phosphate synthase